MSFLVKWLLGSVGHVFTGNWGMCIGGSHNFMPNMSQYVKKVRLRWLSVSSLISREFKGYLCCCCRYSVNPSRFDEPFAFGILPTSLVIKMWEASFLTPELPLQLPQLPQSYFSTPEGIKCLDKVNTTLTEDDKKGSLDDSIFFPIWFDDTCLENLSWNCTRDFGQLRSSRWLHTAPPRESCYCN